MRHRVPRGLCHGRRGAVELHLIEFDPHRQRRTHLHVHHLRGERLDEIPGAGDAIRKKLVELVDTGQLEYYEKLKEGVPPGVMELLKVPGVGPKTAEMLVNEGGINSIDELEKALTDEKALPRITGKTREKILQGIKDLRSGGRVKLHAGD